MTRVPEARGRRAAAGRGQGCARARVRHGLRLGLARAARGTADRDRRLRRAARDGAALPAGVRARVPARARERRVAAARGRVLRPGRLGVRREHLGRSVPLDRRGGARPAPGRPASCCWSTATVLVLCLPELDADLPAGTRVPAAVLRHAPLRVAGRQRGRLPPRLRRLDPPASATTASRSRSWSSCRATRMRRRAAHDLFTPAWARSWPAEEIWKARKVGVSVPPAPPLLLASTSPQRRAILEQLGIPFDVVAPRYEEDDPPDADPLELVLAHARGKARVRGRRGRRPAGARRRHDASGATAGVYGKPADAEDAATMLDAPRRPHARASSRASACSRPAGRRSTSRDDRVTFRPLTAARPRRVRRDRRVGGTRRRLRDPGPRRRARRADRGRLPERRRPPGGAARPAARRALPRRLRLRLSGAVSRLGRRLDRRLDVACTLALRGHLRPPDRLRRPRHGRRPRHRQHARLRARPRHRALRAVGRRDRPAHRRGARRRRRGEAHARPHAGHDHGDPAAEGRRHRRLRRDRADAPPLHPEGAPEPLRAPARRRLRPVGRDRRREARRRGGDALGGRARRRT